MDKVSDGWLLYDFRRSNELAHRVLKIPSGQKCTRRFFYWKPLNGEPVKIVHAIEPYVLSHLPGREIRYESQVSLERALGEILKGVKSVAMEVSKIPYISRVDAGTVAMVEAMGVQVVSSAPLLAQHTSVLDDEQIEGAKRAGEALDRIATAVWRWVDVGASEWDVQEFMLKEMKREGLITDHPPACAIDANSANPHYEAKETTALRVKPGSIILIDLWGKFEGERSIFADITRMAVMGEPSRKMEEIFSIVRKAQRDATDFVRERWKRGVRMTGAEVDRVARGGIEEAGYGPQFLHRTGHSIDVELHGSGAHIDSIECPDDRSLLESTLFSVEPGIYLPGEFGVRLEYDLLLRRGGSVEIVGGVEETLTRLNLGGSNQKSGPSVDRLGQA